MASGLFAPLLSSSTAPLSKRLQTLLQRPGARRHPARFRPFQITAPARPEPVERHVSTPPCAFRRPCGGRGL